MFLCVLVYVYVRIFRGAWPQTLRTVKIPFKKNKRGKSAPSSGTTLAPQKREKKWAGVRDKQFHQRRVFVEFLSVSKRLPNAIVQTSHFAKSNRDGHIFCHDGRRL